MKKSILTIGMLFTCLLASAQFYVSASGGIAVAVDQEVLGSRISSTGTTDLRGSYGEGLNGQLRVGYFFNDKFGVEVAGGYLYGFDQQVNEIAGSLDMYARGRAFGASISGVYNFSEKFYGRIGALTKVGGKTEAVTSLDIDAAFIESDFTTEFHGKLPIGIIGALGYKIPLTENLSLFGEVEYLSINVTRDTSSLGSFSATQLGNPITSDDLYTTLQGLTLLTGDTQYAELSTLLLEDAEWGTGDLPSREAPYSSFGINFGITYKF